MNRPEQPTKMFPLSLLVAIMLLPAICNAQEPIQDGQRELVDRWHSSHWGGPFQVDPSTLGQRLHAELERCEDPADVYDEVSCHLFKGLQEMESGRLDTGRASLNRCLKLVEQENDQLGTILILAAMAEAEQYFQRPEESMRLFQQAAALVERLAATNEPIRLEIMRILTRLGGFPEDVFQQFAPMIQLMRAQFVKLMEVMVRDSFGMMLFDSKQTAAARRELERAAELSGQLFGLFDGQVLGHLARVHQQEGDFRRATELFEKALASAKQMGDLGQQFRLFEHLAELGLERGRFEDAIGAYEKALSFTRQGRNPAKEAEVLTSLADIHGQLGDIPLARRRIREALEIADRSNDRWAMVQTRLSAASLSFWTGHYEAVIETLESALDLLGAMESARPEISMAKVSALLLQAQVYLMLDRADEVGAKVQDALDLATQWNFVEGQLLGRLLLDWSRSGPSAHFVNALAEVGPALLSSASPTLRAFGQQSEAAYRILAAIDQPASPKPVADAWRDRGAASQLPFVRHIGLTEQILRAGRERRFDVAYDLAEALVTDAARVEQREFEALGTMLKAALLWKGGEKEKAASTTLEGLELLEGIVDDFRTEGMIRRFMGGYRHSLYEISVAMLARTGRIESAFDLAERARARALNHQLGNQRLAPLGEESDLHQQLEGLRREIEAELRTHTDEEALAAKRFAYEELATRARREDPEYAELRSIETSTLEELQERTLPPKTTLVAYFFTQEGLLAWVVDRQKVALEWLTGFDIEANRLEIACFARRLGRQPRGSQPSEGCGSGPLDRLQDEYYQRLWRPLRKHIRHPSVIIVPHQEIHYLPFAALRDEQGRLLAEQRTLSYLPSISVLRHLDRKSSPFEGRVLVLGDPERSSEDAEDHLLPPLNGARDEAEAIAELFGTQAQVGSQATEAAIWEAAGQIDLLHVAAHGIYRPRAPRFSRIVLAAGNGHDGDLEVEEVYRALDLRGVDLVTLSACQTALGEHTRGDEIIGLNRAFLYAGSPAVLSTLWRVDDNATSFWMKRFYEYLIDGSTYAEAVRKAQLETRSQPRWSDPHYWADFVLTGNADLRWTAKIPEQTRGRGRNPTSPSF